MPGERAQRLYTEYEFLALLERVLPEILGARIIAEPNLGHARPDFLAAWPDTEQEAIIEAKTVTPNTKTRLYEVAKQLHRYHDLYLEAFPHKPSPDLVLAVPGTFSPQLIEFLHQAGIRRVIDGAIIRNVAGPNVLENLMARPAESQPPEFQSASASLLNRLESLQPGKDHWSSYQQLCGDVLTLLLCPPLSRPIGESANDSRINRRDFVLPNYAMSGYWEFMRSHYQAHYVVVDAKNYKGNVKKKEILQIANYLNPHGTGLFGIIISRSGGDRSAELTRREQWIIHRKLIILLNDDDLRQMISMRAADIDPADLIRQKIEDFRLGF